MSLWFINLTVLLQHMQDMSFIHCKAKFFIEKTQIYLSANSLIVIYLQVYNLVNLEQHVGGGANASLSYSEETQTVYCSFNR